MRSFPAFSRTDPIDGVTTNGVSASTAGTARFASALSVDNFIKKTSVIHYSQKAFRHEAADIMRLAEIEGLSAHARSIKVRLKKEDSGI